MHDPRVTTPRRLSFVVGTSLLGLSTSLSLGCKPPIVNEGPQEPPHVNEGPQPDPEDDADAGSVDDEPEEAPPAEPEVEEPSYVNTAHVPDKR